MPAMNGEPATLAGLLERAARDRPDGAAYVFRGSGISFMELRQDALLLASHLASAGVRPGDRVALVLPAGLDFMRFFWGAQCAGATTAAFNPHVPATLLVRRVQRVRPSILVTDDAAVIAEAVRQGIPVVAPHEPPVVTRRDPQVAASSPSCVDDDDRLAFLQPTSGTSGESRAVMIRHRNVLATLRASASALGLCAEDVFVAWVPPWHDLGLVRFVIGSVYSMATCHLVPPAIRTIPEWLGTIARVRGTITGAPDFAYRLATELVKENVDLSSLRYATNGGEPVRLRTIERFEQRFGLSGAVRPGYGLAEATLGVSTVRPGQPLRTDGRGHVSCGTPFPGADVRIAGDGEILVRGEGVFAGYFDADDATSETFREGWLLTGDYGHLDDAGELFVLGRKRAMIKRGGAVLAPRELEEIAQDVAGVRIAAAIGVPSDGGTTEEIVVALEVGAAFEPGVVAVNVRSALQEVLGFTPERVVVVSSHSIPRTYNGKVRHAELRRQWIAGEIGASLTADPSH